MSQVAAVVTDYSPEVIAGALIEAYRQLTGRDPPSRTSWTYPLAQIAAEGWQGKYALNNNPGNLSWRFPPAVDWYVNPNVVSPPAPSQWSSFPTLLDGCVGFLLALQSHGALAAADASDLAGYVAALRPWYLGSGGDYATYGNNIAASAARYATLVPVPYSPGVVQPVVTPPIHPPKASGALVALGVAALAVVAGYAAYQGMQRRPLPPDMQRRPVLPPDMRRPVQPDPLPW